MNDNYAGMIRQDFHEFLQSRRISITDGHESAVLDTLIDAIGTEMAVLADKAKTRSLSFKDLTRSLEDLTWAVYHKTGRREQVKTGLDFVPGLGWTVSRDAMQGGGPYQKGPVEISPEAAIEAFAEEYENDGSTSP